jgi:L-alanine-DL-glutamate epimerase-like enolase superfamily enzyme
MATSAVDIALWDLKARLLGQPLYRVLPAFRDRVLIYGSGGFTNYPLPRLCEQISDWAAQGLTRMKIKTSRHPDQDPARLTAVRKEAGDDVQLFTDANGALTRKSALYWADRFAHDWGVCWFEEPVSSQDPEGLRLLRDRGPAGLDITAGEYGYVLPDFAALLNAGPWTACRPTSRGAGGSPACCRSAAWPRRIRWSCPRTARRRSARTPAAACRRPGTWSTSIPMSASRTWPSTACCVLKAAPCTPIPIGPASAWR